MTKREIKNMIQATIDDAIASQQKLTEIEKVACVAVAAIGISVATAMKVNAKLCAMKRSVKKCERRLDELEALCTDPVM